jgi:hypothetical protein
MLSIKSGSGHFTEVDMMHVHNTNYCLIEVVTKAGLTVCSLENIWWIISLTYLFRPIFVPPYKNNIVFNSHNINISSSL